MKWNDVVMHTLYIYMYIFNVFWLAKVQNNFAFWIKNMSFPTILISLCPALKRFRAHGDHSPLAETG